MSTSLGIAVCRSSGHNPVSHLLGCQRCFVNLGPTREVPQIGLSDHAVSFDSCSDVKRCPLKSKIQLNCVGGELYEMRAERLLGGRDPVQPQVFGGRFRILDLRVEGLSGTH